jgi:hypothetical protein
MRRSENRCLSQIITVPLFSSFVVPLAIGMADSCGGRNPKESPLFV